MIWECYRPFGLDCSGMPPLSCSAFGDTFVVAVGTGCEECTDGVVTVTLIVTVGFAYAYVWRRGGLDWN